MKIAVFRGMTTATILAVCIFPLLSVIGLKWSGGATLEGEQRFTIDLAYKPNDQPGLPDELEITAPPNMELAVYLNDRLLNVARTDKTGKHNLIMPVLPQRRNEIIALPTEIDSSTLPLFYDPYGFQKLNILPEIKIIGEPFLAAAFLHADELHIYGSAAPGNKLRIGAEGCDKAVDSEPDGEGSFHAILPSNGAGSLPQWYCLLVSSAEAQTEFRVEAPAQRYARGEGIWKRSVDLKFSVTDVRLVFTIEMPTGYLVYRNLTEGNLSETQFIEYVFGDVTLNTFMDPRLTTWRQEKQSHSDRVKVIIETQPLVFLVPGDSTTAFQLDASSLEDSIPPYSRTDSINATLDGVRMTESKSSPTASNETTQTWTGALADSPSLRVWVSRNPAPLADPIGRARLLDSISDIVSSLRIRTVPLLRESVEGQIVGLLPERVPGPVQVQVYDTYRAAYEADPFIDEQAAKPNFQSYLRDLPTQIPDWVTRLFFGAMWLIPALMTYYVLRKEAQPNTELAYLVLGTAALILLTLDWQPLLTYAGLDRADAIHWTTSALMVFAVLFFPLPKWTKWLSRRPIALLLSGFFLAPVLTFTSQLLLNFIPDGWVSASLTGLSILGFFFLLWLASQTGRSDPRHPSAGFILTGLIGVYALGYPIQSLPISANLSGTLGVSTAGIGLIRPLLPLVLLLGIIMNLRHNFDRPLGGEFSLTERGLARILTVAFAIGVSPSWGFIPLSVLAGLFLFEWLVPEVLLEPAKTVRDFANNHHAEGVSQILVLNRQTRLWRAVETNLQKQVREGVLEDEPYRQKREDLELSARALERPKYLSSKTHNLTLRDLAFNFGAGPNHHDNLQHALAWGLLLVAPLVLAQVWSLTREGMTSSLPFPFLGIGVRLLGCAAQYLAGAALLGYFFPYLRGRNGLEKGGWTAFAIVVAFLPYHLLYASSFNDWIAVIIWAGSVLTYYLLVGFLAFDMQTLSRFNISWTRLPDLYDFGALAFYLTGSGTPLITTLFTALFGNIQELVPALLKVMFPSFTLTSAQFELLQMLLDLASRVTSGIFR